MPKPSISLRLPSKAETRSSSSLSPHKSLDWHTSQEGLSWARQLIQRRDALFQCLTKFNDRILRNYRNYVADPAIRDPRDPIKEKWRSFVMPPKPWANTNSAAAVISDIITSVDPIIQATRRRDLDQNQAIYAENVSTYWLDGNQFDTRILPVLARSVEIGATQFLKMTWVDRRRNAQFRYTTEDFENWWNQAMIAAQQTGVPMPDRRVDPDAHDVWVQQMQGAGQDLADYPRGGMGMSAGYVGPWYTLPMPWRIAYDPFVDDIQHQGVVFETMIMPKSYVDGLSIDGDPRAPYDAAAVNHARRRAAQSVSRFTTHEQQYYNLLGLDHSSYPSFDQAPFDEITECYMANDPERKFAVILNGVCCVNKSYDAALAHGDNPYVEVNRVRMPASAVGLSPFTPTETLLYESVALRSGRLDGMTLAANPAWRASGAGASSINQINSLKPGAVYHNIGKEDLTPLTFNMPNEIFKEDRQTAFDIDEGWGVDSSTRGQQASVGRVSLGEYQGRRTQATLPLISVAREIEAAVERTIPWGFHMFMAYAPPDTLVKLSGRMQRLDNIKLREALDLDLRFQGATQTRNRAEQAQIVLMIQEKFKGVLGPMEQREIMKIVWSLNGLQDLSTILDEQTGQQMQARFLGIPPPGAAGLMGGPAGPGGPNGAPPAGPAGGPPGPTGAPQGAARGPAMPPPPPGR